MGRIDAQTFAICMNSMLLTLPSEPEQTLDAKQLNYDQPSSHTSTLSPDTAEKKPYMQSHLESSRDCETSSRTRAGPESVATRI